MKKFMSFALALCMAVSLAACGGATSSSAAESTAGSTAAEASGTASSTAAIKVGGIGPVTGGAAVYGIAVKNGMELAVADINAEGGIQFEIKFADDEHDAEKSVNAYNSLKDWGMQLLMGTVTSTPCVAVQAEAKADNMYLLTPSASSTSVISDAQGNFYGNSFQVCFTDPNQGVASADYIADNKIASKVGIIYDSSDVYSSGIYEKFVAEAKTKGLEVVAAEAFTADSKTDFSVQVQKMQSAGAELVFLPIYYTEASLILNTADQIGYKPMFFGCDGLDGLLGVDNFDTTLAEGVMLLTPFAADATDDATKDFVAKYEAAYGETPIQFAADAYDAMYIIKAACEKAGVTADMDMSAICDALKVAMTEISVDGLTGEGMTWSATGEVNKAPKAVKIVDGAYAAM